MQQESDHNSYNDEESPREKHNKYEGQHNRPQIVVPSSKNKLKACLRCRLLKTQEQWRDDNICENCMEQRDDIRTSITSKFQNVVTILDPSKSWLRKRIGISRRIVPGSYAVNVYEQY